MEEIVNGLAGQPLLVLYQYQHEAQRMMKRFPDALWISSKTSEEDFNQALLDWNAGLLPIIIGHPASMGHGVDRLQHNCHNLLWFGLPWAFDLYDQSNKRIDRQGQEHPVMRHRLIMDGTVDELVVLALEEKESTEAQVRDLIEAYGKTKLGETK
jgi:SNF2 family DNA or RNA helicase